MPLYHAIDEWLHSLAKTSTNYGLTHADHREANVLFDGQKITIIDFDE